MPPRTLSAWIEILRQTCAALFATDRDGRWQSEALDRILDGILGSATVEDEVSTTSLEFVDVRRLIDERLESKPGRPDYFRGGITVSSLTPLRWIPFRVVCLLGMDQSAFASTSTPGDDLAAASPELGDPDPRAELRQSLLEAVLAADDRLVVVRDGHDVRTNQEVSRSVVVAELFDAVLSLVDPDDSGRSWPGASRSTIPASRSTIGASKGAALVPGLVWGFDTRSLDGRGPAAVGRPTGRPSWRPRSSRWTPTSSNSISSGGSSGIPLPSSSAQRLGARLAEADEEPSSVLPVEIDGLGRWQVATRMLDARMGGMSTDQWRAVERERGTLPPGLLEGSAVEAIALDVDALVAAAAARGIGRGPAEPFEVDVELADGRRVVGSVPLRLQGAWRGPARVGFSVLKPEYRIHAWLDLICLGAADPSERWRSVALGRPEKTGQPADAFDIGMAGDPPTWSATARRRWRWQSTVSCRGMREPIPFFPVLSYAVHRGWPPRPAGCTTFPYQEGGNPSVVLAHGRLGFNEVMCLPPRAGDPGDGRDRVSRFAGYLFGAMDDTTRAWTSPVGGVTGPARRTVMTATPDITFAVDDDLPERWIGHRGQRRARARPTRSPTWPPGTSPSRTSRPPSC